MALATGGFTTYTAIGNREDLTDVIYNISPTDTPFISSIKKTKARAVLHEWQTDTLAAAVSTNAQLEGDAVTVSTSTPTTRQQNYCQISFKTAAVTGTQEAVDKAGRNSEISYQMAKRAKELKRDVETAMTGNQGWVAGGSTLARQMRSLRSWLKSNTSTETNGGNSSNGSAAADDSSVLRTMTEAMLKTVIQSCFTNGADPGIIMVGPYNKTVVSGFTGRTQARQNIAKDRIQAAAHLYASDFGELRVIPNRFQRERDAFVLDPSMAAVAHLQNYKTINLAKVGDSERRQLLVECTLEMCNEQAHGVVADLNTQAT